MIKTVLITGATGLIGRHLTQLLLNEGYIIHTLSRKGIPEWPEIKSFSWDPEKGIIDKKCVENVDAIVHLAGESIAGKPWTSSRKQKIITSRTASIRLLYKLIQSNPLSKVNTVISASAMGYYGDRADEILTEEAQPGNDFMAQTCISWENAVSEGELLGLRVVKLRTGIVLTSEGGALPQLAGPVRAGFGTALGSGKQWMPWIHIDDAVRMYKFVLNNDEASGNYNQCSPIPVTNRQMTSAIADVLGKPLWLPGVPAFILRIALGEMKAVILNSTRTSANKIINLGFRFRFNDLGEALQNIYGKKSG